MGYHLEPIGSCYSRPAHLIVQLRCEIHNGSQLETEVEEGIAQYGLRWMVDGRVVGFVADPKKTIVIGKGTFVDVQLYDLRPS